MSRRAALPRTPESAVLRGVLALEREFGPDVLRLHRRNTGGRYNRQGRYVEFNPPGAADVWGVLRGGRHLEIECKAPDFDPAKASKEARVRFCLQVGWLMWTNELGGVGFWCKHPDQARAVITRCLASPRVRVEFGEAPCFWPTLTDEEPA